jgi:hypothetical protein
MEGLNENQKGSQFRKMMLMALIERMERLERAQRSEVESKAFQVIENDNCRIQVCLN